ncbi:MAG: DinB-like domain protein, partial [Gemmatimonadetes bacterium]|nr:DinB-like domain protein [Gemmatimonadota bacterium]
MRGPIAGVSAALQPVAHSLLQSVEEVRATLPTLTLEEIWSRPKGIASVGYHVRHAMGSIDRLFTYARGEQLSDEQFGVLVAEADPT